MKTNTTLLFLTLVAAARSETVGLWHFDEAVATAGAAITTAENATTPGTLDATPGSGIPLYSADVPYASIYDPVSKQTYANSFSLDASGQDAHLLTPNAITLDSSFTVEFFVKMIGEPASYERILDRSQSADLSWQIDFDHAANLSFGRIRTRWDTPAGAPDNNAEQGVDENWNFTLAPSGNSSASKIFVDTGAKDAEGADVGPQNTGDANDYVYDAASTNPNETDVFLQGDGMNDVPEWHHVAMSFDETTGQIRFYFDYALAQTRTLSDSEGDGYTHPAAGLRFGKLNGAEYGLLLDEIRYSDEILTSDDFLRQTAEGSANVVAYWRMDEESAVDGGNIVEVANEASALLPAVAAAGTPTYSTDIPAPNIFDPITNTTSANNFSMDVTTANSRLDVTNDDALNTSFTLEFFMKLSGEPGGYHAFFRRLQLNDLRWQVDFDHAAKTSYGRIRTRWDTPGEAGPDGSNDAGIDENVNFVVGPTGGTNIPDRQRFWIDTDPGDGLAASYDDPADWSLDGDGVNDVEAWRHVAITFDEELGTISFYQDYELIQSRTLSDSLMDGYTHPNGNLVFGKLTNADYGMLLDEVRYTGDVLKPFQFLQAVTEPAKEFKITDLVYDSVTPGATITWDTVRGRLYSLDFSEDLVNWFEILEEEIAEGDTMSYTDNVNPGGSTNLFYRVREIN